MNRVARFIAGNSLASSAVRSFLAALAGVGALICAGPVLAKSNIPDVNEAGRVLAELDDWRAMMFVLIFVLISDRLATAWYRAIERKDRREERKELIKTNNNLSESIDRLTEAQSKASERILETSSRRDQVVMLHHARVESLLSRVEHLLSRLEE